MPTLLYGLMGHAPTDSQATIH
ncbi:hypothetical protein DSUL_20546 [Desulfovibrionales bacterium]